MRLEAKPTIFEFVGYRFEPAEKKIFFDYKVSFTSADFVLFTETINLPAVPELEGLPKELYEKVLQDLHLALGISYYKLYCSKKIKTGYVFSQEEANFWNDFYEKGLGEFFYRNKLNPAIFPGFKSVKNKVCKNYRLEKNGKFLLGIGGGKDSVVASELLKNYGANFSTVFIQTQKESLLVDKMLTQIGVESFKIKRHLDEKIFDEAVGYYTGHIPISGVYAFLGILSCIFYGYSYFVVANEFSSNFGNVKYKGRTVNHQWSKSSEFETSFQDYVRKFITPDVFYFSLIRPFYEIRIAEMFAKMENYLYTFSSCNNNFKINLAKNPSTGSGQEKLWCGHCAKCVFVFLMLSPFLPKEKLISIFGKNIFQSEEALGNLRDILGFGKIKPFDCVGTPEEAKVAFYMARETFKDDMAGKAFLPKIDAQGNRIKKLIEKVFKTQSSSVPDYIKFLGMKSALILGYGKEGIATEEFLKTNFFGLKIGIADAKDDPRYLEKQEGYDIAIRSPGIVKENLKIPYTTATNIFFSYVRQIPGVKIIGVTGTKGKSTTASLIYHILKMAGKTVQLSGNIGTPMLLATAEKIKPNTIFVLELSSYQLDDIKYSPDVAVVTSLFPEHMDYHYNIKNYYTAKKNIIKYQESDNIFVYNAKNKKMLSWLKDAKSKAVSFVSEKFIAGINIPLIGEHNKENVRAAVSAVKCFDVSDEVIKEGIESFKPLSHRLEFVGEFKDIKFYDDAISTTPESTIVAINSLSKIGTIFLGGQDRGYKFSSLEKVIKKHKIKNIVLFPETGKKIFKSKKGFNILETESMEEAVKFAYEHTPKGEICLLSCASPSYSLWKDFEEKGDQFKFWVKYFSKSKDEKTL